MNVSWLFLVSARHISNQCLWCVLPYIVCKMRADLLTSWESEWSICNTWMLSGYERGGVQGRARLTQCVAS